LESDMNVDPKIIDRAGNNAVVTCAACEKPYLAAPIPKSGRACPHCGKTRVTIGMKKGDPVHMEMVDQQ
jgi:DNA-directed RNA polymerase subunit RPC12/RpoP